MKPTDAIPAIVLFGPLLFPIARQVGVHDVHYAMIVILAMGIRPLCARVRHSTKVVYRPKPLRMWDSARLPRHTKSLKTRSHFFALGYHHLRIEACSQYQIQANFHIRWIDVLFRCFWTCSVGWLPLTAQGQWCLGYSANDDSAPGRGYPGGHGDRHHWRRGQAFECVGTWY